MERGLEHVVDPEYKKQNNWGPDAKGRFADDGDLQMITYC